MDVVEFFQRSTGKWRSQRTTHHLAFKRAEAGESEIRVEGLAADHPQVIEICQLHQVEPTLAIGGAFVSWQGSMGWDKEEEDHTGSTVFALIPDADHPQKGTLLRERGYAEIVPVAGRYHMNDEDELVLTTEYDTMSSTERFSFASPNIRMRTSTVKRFGGFSTATFCTEFRIADASDAALESDETDSNQSADLPQNVVEPTQYFSSLGW
ncbi:MAG: phycobiliprotein lyase [Leptolyngbyaceae cyanobacterium SU_3_3]|nr:phycobiliprotein lyase [Leptolyngbyaceae cyanobacterium SU_3_3]NJR48692.1 phycobiliprotein lyase [Leptolyngbyaceae cyanobacterium CSU_1_3]